MYDTLDSMMDHITFAYTEKDVKLQEKFLKDKVLDKINIKSFKILENEIKKDNNLIHDALLLFSVVKIRTSRRFDKNIAEEIIFYIDAEVLKHKKKK